MHKYRDLFLLAFTLAVVLTPIVRALAFRFKVLDHPKGHGIHDFPVPRIGGIALFAAFLVGVLSRMDLSMPLKGILLGSSVIFITGLLDDLFQLKAKLRLAIQGVTLAVMMFKYGVILDVFEMTVLNAFFTALGIIGITNAVNFLDNMDGLAAGLVSISSLAIFTVSYWTGQIWLGYLSMGLVGACLGFLIFNLRRAHVFMGDCGSTFLGFTLASLAVMADWSSILPVTAAAPVLILGLPILDMVLITVLRIKEDKVRTLKEWIDYAGRDHISHRVMRLGFGKRGAVFSLWAVQAVLCGLGLWIAKTQTFQAGIWGCVFFALASTIVIALFRRRRHVLLTMNGRKIPKRSAPLTSADIPTEDEESKETVGV